MYSMFPMVEKSYRVNITDEIERDLRFLGQSRVDALTSPFAMKLLKEKGGVKLYELCEKEFYTMKAVTTVHAPIQEVMHMLRMDTTSQLRETMGEIFGTLFLDGVVLYKKPDSPTRSNEGLSVSWTALQASKPNLPHRDYVFLRYSDVFEKNLEHGSLYQNNGSGLYIGASIWGIYRARRLRAAASLSERGASASSSLGYCRGGDCTRWPAGDLIVSVRESPAVTLCPRSPARG